MKGTAVRLELQGQFLTAPGRRTKKNIPVVHIDSLHCLPVHKQKELGILGVVPLIDLGAHMKPHTFTVQFFRHLINRLKPVMAVFSIPVHVLAVKILPGPFCCLRISRVYVIPLLILPLPNGKFLLHLKLF